MNKLISPNKFLLIIGCLLVFPVGARAATLYLMPSSQTIYEGDTFLIDVRINTEGKEINSVGAELIFPEVLEAVDFSEGNSILTLWPKKPATEKPGLISFVGGTPQGFIGDGSILKITFRAASNLQQEGSRMQVSFGENSKVLLNDGKGTKSPLAFLEGNYQIIKRSGDLPVISSRTHDDQNKWYSKNSLAIRWNWKEENLYSYLLSHNPLDMPDEIPDEPEGELMWIGEMEYRRLEDGIYYFHLREAVQNEQKELVWSPKATFRAMIDTVPPKEFTPEIGQEQTVFEGKYFLSFGSHDGLSGIDHYEVVEIMDGQGATSDTEGWKVANSPYLLEDQNLNSIIKVKAIDKASNERIAEIIPPKRPLPYKTIIAGLAGVGVAIGVMWVLKRIITKLLQKKTREY